MIGGRWDLDSTLGENWSAAGSARLQGSVHWGKEAVLGCFHNLDHPNVLAGIEDLSDLQSCQGWMPAAGWWTPPRWESWGRWWAGWWWSRLALRRSRWRPEQRLRRSRPSWATSSQTSGSQHGLAFLLLSEIMPSETDVPLKAIYICELDWMGLGLEISGRDYAIEHLLC